MHLRNFLLAVAAQLLSVCSADEHQQFYRWNLPVELAGHDVYRRQGPLPGYHPEFGTCGSGTTCENACGGNWKLCKASTSLSLFCYNEVELNQTCCENGSGRELHRLHLWQTVLTIHWYRGLRQRILLRLERVRRKDMVLQGCEFARWSSNVKKTLTTAKGSKSQGMRC